MEKEYSDTWSELQESVAELERVPHEIKMSPSRENDVCDEDYEEDYETTEEKIKRLLISI